MMSPPDSAPAADPRARAAQTKRDRTRRALLDAADSTFGSRGWARTRMEDIAAAAGVSPATAYNHFPTKHALLGHVYGPLVRPLAVQAERDITSGRSTVDALSDQLRALARISFRYRKLTAAFWSAVQEYTSRVAGPPDPQDDVDPRTLAPITDSLRAIIECGQLRGELRGYPPASELSTLIVNVLLQRAVNHPEDTPDATAELLLTVVFGSLKPELLTDRKVGERPFRGAG